MDSSHVAEDVDGSPSAAISLHTLDLTDQLHHHQSPDHSTLQADTDTLDLTQDPV